MRVCARICVVVCVRAQACLCVSVCVCICTPCMCRVFVGGKGLIGYTHRRTKTHAVFFSICYLAYIVFNNRLWSRWKTVKPVPSRTTDTTRFHLPHDTTQALFIWPSSSSKLFNFFFLFSIRQLSRRRGLFFYDAYTFWRLQMSVDTIMPTCIIKCFPRPFYFSDQRIWKWPCTEIDNTKGKTNSLFLFSSTTRQME